MTETPPRDPETGQFVSSNSGDQTTETVTVPTANATDVELRQSIAAHLGQSLYDERQYYDTFDWPSVGGIDAEQYYATYTRNPFAKPVVDRPAFTSWRDDPEIIDEGEDDETDFEEDVVRAAREHDLWSYAERLDRLAGIGRYGVLVFVTSDLDGPDDLEAEFDPSAADGDGLDMINQVKVFSEVSIDDIEWGTIEEAGSGRWGRPVQYTIDFAPEADTDSSKSDRAYEVHWSRTIAAPATRLLDDDFFGRPRLEPVFNTLRDIEKTMGSVAEMAYRGAEKGLALTFDPEDVNVDPGGDFMSDMEEEMQEWHHGLQWYFRTVGDVQELGGDIADVRRIFEPHLSALASATNIPKRVFEGDPAGALASASEDTQAYFGMIEERRTEYCNPHIVRPMLDWLQEYGIVSEPEDDHVGFQWPALRVMSEKEQAELADIRIRAGRLSGAMLVDEVREELGLEPQGGEIGSMPIAEFQAIVAGGGGAGAPAANAVSAVRDAVTEAAETGTAAGRTDARIQRGQEADD